jgi:molybdenum cofactor synthesis domain-containing protein
MASTAWIVTVSDRAAAGTRADASGPALRERLLQLGFQIAGESLVPDDRLELARLLAGLCDRGAADLVVTTGGSGLAPRDLTPEATLDIAQRSVPGLMELARSRCVQQTPFAALSRGVAAARARALIVNLPGHPRAALQTLDAIADVLAHAVGILARTPADCDVTGRAPDPAADASSGVDRAAGVPREPRGDR